MADLSRRGFLGAAGAAGAFGKQAVAAGLSGMATVGGGDAVNRVSGTVGSIGSGRGEWARRRLEIARKLFGTGDIPAWKHRELLRRAKGAATTFDPDIASLQSVSLQGKYLMQVRREYDRAVAYGQTEPEWDLEEVLWSEREGID